MGKPILILVSSLIVLCSCNLKCRNSELTATDHDSLKCKMDSSVNEFQLMNSSSIDSVFAHQVDNHTVNDFQFGEGVYLSNSLNNEFLFLKLNNGRVGLQFDEFVVTDSIPTEFSSRYIHSNTPRFITSNGAYIGMSKTEFLNLYLSENNAKIVLDSLYIQYDSINLLYNHFLFKNDTLKCIQIGYDW